MNIHDDKLDKYLRKLENSNNSIDKMHYYKRASKRLEKLKSEYNKISSTIQVHSVDKNDKNDKKNKHNRKKTNNDDIINPDNKMETHQQSKLSIDNLISELEKIDQQLLDSDVELVDVISKYLEYRTFINALESETTNFIKEINNVEKEKNNILIKKINLTDIF